MRWVRTYWPDEDTTFLFEVRPNGWISRCVTS